MTETKVHLRAEVEKRLAAVDPERRAEASASVCRIVPRLPAWRRAAVVLGFMPLPAEVDIRPLFPAARSAGKRVGLPRVIGDDLEFLRFDEDTSFERSAPGILEPSGDEGRLWPGPQSSGHWLVLVPGVAFDVGGHRLGRGKGYYDRFLAALAAGGRRFTCLGVCFRRQIVDAVPVGAADYVLDGLVCEDGVYLRS